MSSQSIYETTFEDRPHFAALDGHHTYDVAIVGGGLTGISAALTLAEQGFEVCVLEAGQLGAGGSGRNGGHVCQGWPNDFHHISRQLSTEDADIAWEAGMAAVSLVKDRVAKHKIDCDLTFGYLHAALHKKQMHGLDEMQEEWEDRGYDAFTRLEGSAAMDAHIGSDAYVGALHDMGCGHMQPLRYLHGLARAATTAGVTIYEQSGVTKIDRGARKIVHSVTGGTVTARVVLLCGNAYLADIALPEMKSRLAQVTSSVLATKPLSPNLVKQILPTGAAVADCNAALNYYRIDADNRMIFGGRASYTNVNLGNVESDLRRRMTDVFPLLTHAETEQVWSGRIGITVNRIPQFGRTNDDIYYVQGFSGHGVALTGQAGTMLAMAITGDQKQFDVMRGLAHLPFPGGPFRTPALAIGMAYHKLRDRLKI